MIKSVTVTNYLGESIKLELARPESSGFIITSITGLGPGKATVNTTEISTMDGGLFNSARASARNIVMSVTYLNEDGTTIEDIRQLSYKYFPLKKMVTLSFEMDNRQASIEGYVESNDPTIFSQNESSDISIICPNPLFYSVRKATTVFSGLEPMFEFPFSNESLTEPLLEFTRIRKNLEQTIFYEGDADIGITITIHAVGPASMITIYNTGTREVMKLDTDKLELMTGSGIKAGDDIIICTVVGKKSITLLRDGENVNILNCMSKDSDWFRLAKGDNVIAYTAEEGVDNLQFSVENQIAYEGM